MRREPEAKGAAFLVTYKCEEVERKLLLALHDSEQGQLSAVASKIREVSKQYDQWTVQPESVAEAAQTEGQADGAVPIVVDHEYPGHGP